MSSIKTDFLKMLDSYLELRQLQKTFFKTGDKAVLNRSKAMEKSLDSLAEFYRANLKTETTQTEITQTEITYAGLKELGFVVFPEGDGTTRYHFEVPDGVVHFDTMLIAEWSSVSNAFDFWLQNYSYGAVESHDLPLVDIRTIEDVKEFISTLEKFI